MIFGRRVTRRYRGQPQTVIEDLHLPNPVIRRHYGHGFIRQYIRDRRDALGTRPRTATPDQLSDEEVRAYPAYLIHHRKLSWSTCSQAAHPLCAAPRWHGVHPHAEPASPAATATLLG